MTAEHRGLALEAPAKVNLYLHVLGRRPDGFHRLDSLVVFVALADSLIARPADRLSLTIAGPHGSSIAAESDNLVLRAARLLADEAGLRPAADLRLVKRIPVAAGLGGGSADAAAALRLLDRLWRIQAGATDLARLGARLGADVPVCLVGRPTLVRGIGERTAAAPPPPPLALVLVNPRRPLATGRVFAACEPKGGRPTRPISAVTDTAAFAARLARRRNDLTTAATRLEPAIPAMLAALNVAGAELARMSGSGATCFGIFGARRAAQQAADWLSREHPDWWIAVTQARRAPPTARLVA